MSKLDEKKKKKREALLSAAFHLFNTKGIKATSISDIANEADVAKGTFYLYFKDKFDLRDKLIAAKATQVVLQAADEINLDAVNPHTVNFTDTIVDIVDAILDRMEKEPQLLRFITKNLSWGVFHQMVLDDEGEYEVSFYDGYYKLIEETGMHFENPDLLLFMIVELVGGCCYQVILHQMPVTLTELKPHLYQSIRDMIGNQEI